MTENAKPTTTDAGIPVASDEHSLTVGPDGPILLQDHYLIEQMANFNRERIPERQPHAKGGGAFGRFEVLADVSQYTKAAVFQPGTTTDTLIRFSTVAGERGSPDTWRDPRGFAIPKKNGLGQANVCYPFDEDGGAREWIREAADYVGSYSGPNLLREDDGVQEEIEDAATQVREKGAGFLSDPEIRDKIEEYAMECAREYLVRRKYKNITRTDKGYCYDYTCTDKGRTIYVEVKGTQTRGEKVILTRKEKAHLESNSDNILYVRHSIDVTSGKAPRVSGGGEKVRIVAEEERPVALVFIAHEHGEEFQVAAVGFVKVQPHDGALRGGACTDGRIFLSLRAALVGFGADYQDKVRLFDLILHPEGPALGDP